MTLSKNHKVLSEPHFHHLLNGDDNNNIPENEIEIISHLVRLVVCFVCQSCLTLCDLLECSPPGSSGQGDFSRQEYCSGLSCLPSGDLSDSGIEPRSPTLYVDSLPC